MGSKEKNRKPRPKPSKPPSEPEAIPKDIGGGDLLKLRDEYQEKMTQAQQQLNQGYDQLERIKAQVAYFKGKLDVIIQLIGKPEVIEK